MAMAPMARSDLFFGDGLDRNRYRHRQIDDLYQNHTVPRHIGLLGVRYWKVKTGPRRLTAPLAHGHWVPGQNDSDCKGRHNRHRTSEEFSRCGCGFYAISSGNDIFNHLYEGEPRGFVGGVIRGWGHINITPSISRSQFAEVIAFADSAPNWLLQMFNVPVISLDQAEDLIIEDIALKRRYGYLHAPPAPQVLPRRTPLFRLW